MYDLMIIGGGPAGRAASVGFLGEHIHPEGLSLEYFVLEVKSG